MVSSACQFHRSESTHHRNSHPLFIQLHQRARATRRSAQRRWRREAVRVRRRPRPAAVPPVAGHSRRRRPTQLQLDASRTAQGSRRPSTACRSFPSRATTRRTARATSDRVRAPGLDKRGPEDPGTSSSASRPGADRRPAVHRVIGRRSAPTSSSGSRRSAGARASCADQTATGVRASRARAPPSRCFNWGQQGPVETRRHIRHAPTRSRQGDAPSARAAGSSLRLRDSLHGRAETRRPVGGEQPGAPHHAQPRRIHARAAGATGRASTRPHSRRSCRAGRCNGRRVLTPSAKTRSGARRAPRSRSASPAPSRSDATRNPAEALSG